MTAPILLIPVWCVLLGLVSLIIAMAVDNDTLGNVGIGFFVLALLGFGMVLTMAALS